MARSTDGVTLTPDGQVYITTDPIGPDSFAANGLYFNAVGQLHVTTTQSPSDVYVDGRRHAMTGELVVGNGTPPQRPYFAVNGLPFRKTDNALVRQVNQTPDPTDPYVRGIRVGPLGGVYMVTADVPPEVEAEPVINDPVDIGVTVTATPATVSGGATKTAQRWYVDGVQVATTVTYTPVLADFGKQLGYEEDWTNSGGTVTGVAPTKTITNDLPQATFDFMSGVLDARLIFTRASAGTYYDSLGVLQTALANVPRFDHDRVTGEALGLLIEGPSTNLWRESENPASTYWEVLSGATKNAPVAGPFGGLIAGEITINAGRMDNQSGMNIAPGSVVTMSFWAKADQDGVLATAILDGALVFQTLDVTTEWAFYEVTYPVTANTVNFIYPVQAQFSTVLVISLAYLQVEVQPFATSYIPTTAAIANRAADICSATGVNLSSWYVENTGAMACAYELSGLKGAGTQGLVGKEPSARWLYSNTGAAVYDGTTIVTAPGTLAAGTVYKSASGFEGAVSSCSTNGASASGAYDGTMGLAGGSMYFGAFSTTSQMYGYLRTVLYWATGKTAAQLDEITSNPNWGNGVSAPDFVAQPQFTASVNDWFRTTLEYVIANPSTAEFRGYWPLENSTIDQLTPTFVVPYPIGAALNVVFTFEVRPRGGASLPTQSTTLVAGRPCHRWVGDLTPGIWYEYRVTRSSASGNVGSGLTTDWRPFYIRPDSVPWTFELEATFLANVVAQPHPRQLPIDWATRVELFRSGGALRDWYTRTKTAMDSTFLPSAVPTRSAFSVNTLMTEHLIHQTCFLLDAIEGGTAYRAQALTRLNTLAIAPATAFLPAGVPLWTDQQSLRTLINVLASAWDYWYDSIQAWAPADKVTYLTLADSKFQEMISNLQSVAVPSNQGDGILGFQGYWRSVTYTNRFYVCYAAACMVGETSIPQLAANLEYATPRLQFNANWYQNYSTGDGAHAECEYYTTTNWFYEPNILDACGGILGRNLFTATKHLGDMVDAMASMYPYVGTSMLYPWSDASDTSTGAVFLNGAMAVPSLTPNVLRSLKAGWPTLTSLAQSQAAQLTALLGKALPDYDTTVPERMSVFKEDSGLFGITSGDITLWSRASPLGSHTHFHADHGAYGVYQGATPLIGWYGAYKYAGPAGVGAASTQASRNSFAHNVVGMDLAVYSAGYQQTLGNQYYLSPISSAGNTYLMKTRGRPLYAKATNEYAYVSQDMTEAYYSVGYELSTARRGLVFIFPGLLLVFDYCVSASGPHTWHHQFKTHTLPTLNASTVLVSNGGHTAELTVPYASGAVTRTLGNQGWWNNATPPQSPPPAPFNNSFDLPSSTSMSMLVAIKLGPTPVGAISASLNGGYIVAKFNYDSTDYLVAYELSTGFISVSCTFTL